MSRNVALSHAVPFQIWLNTIALFLFPIIVNTILTFYHFPTEDPHFKHVMGIARW